MSGAMRKMGVYLGLLEDAEGEYAELDGSYDSYDEPTTTTPRARETAADKGHERGQRRGDSEARVASIAERRRGSGRAQAAPADRSAESGPVRAVAPLTRITTLHPRTYNDARVVGENFRDGIPVIMNLSEMDDADAKRLVDFAAGLVFAVRGSIERVTSKVFLLSPPHVDVAAEDKQRIAEGDFFNQS